MSAAPLLLPRPKRITMLPGTPRPKFGTPRIVRAELASDALPTFSPEAYRIRIDGETAAIDCRTDVGFRRAQSTLEQLASAGAEQSGSLIIEDWPTFATRGVMLDVSRDRVPTTQHLYDFVVTMKELKLNHLQLYTEHTFAYEGHEDVWRGWSPLTPTEILALDDFCNEHDVELSANQNCFGHLAKWLNHPKYQHLAETLGDWVFQNETEAFPRSGPFSLCPTDPRSIALIKDLLGQLLPRIKSPLVNIGCDETFDVGWGRSKAEVETRGRGTVYMDFVRQIADVVNSHGKRPMFWADIALTDPKSIPLIPKDMIGLAWGYEPDAKFGQWCSQLRSSGLDAWVCPGTSSWRSITGRTTERRANIRRAAREGAANGATGFLITDWGDSGHHQQWPISLNAIAEAADAAWNADELDSYDPRSASLHAFGDSTLKIASWLDRLGDADLPLRQRGGRIRPGESPQHLRNSSVLFCDMHMPTKPGNHDDEKLRRGLGSTPIEMWEAATAEVHHLAASRPRRPAGASAAMSHWSDAELSHSLDVACFAALRGLWRRTGKYTSKERTELANWLHTIIATHRELWLKRSREGGLEDSCSFYQRVVADLTEMS